MKTILKTLLVSQLISISAYAADINITDSQMDSLGVKLSSAEPVQVVWSRSYPATITVPNDQIRVLSPMMPGLVNVMYVAEGDKVEKGQKLAEISSAEFLDLQKEYINSQARFEMAKRSFERNQELLNEGIISEKNFLGSRAEYNELKASLYSNEQLLQFSGMDNGALEKLKTDQEMQRNVIISAPYDGVILSQFARTGEHVDEDVPLYQVANLSKLWIEIHVPYMIRDGLEVGNAIRVEGTNQTSNIITIGSMVHEDDQGIVVRGLLNNEDGAFIPGQFTKAYIEQKNKDGNFHRLPTGSISRNGDEASVFIKRNGGFDVIDARVIADEGETIVIDCELSPTDKIAIAGIVVLKGMMDGLGSDE